MVSRLSDEMKLKMAKTIARDHGYFIVEKREMGRHQFITKWLLYREKREYETKNTFVGKRSSVTGLLSFVKTTTGFK